MKLERIMISNFRSIEDIELPIKAINGSYCTVLVGKNEAGKSNILKAINTLFQKEQWTQDTKEHKRKPEVSSDYSTKDEDYYICAGYSMSANEKIEVIKHFEREYTNAKIVKFKNNLSIMDLINTVYDEVLHDYTLGEEQAGKKKWDYEEKIGQYEFIQNVYLKDKVFSLQGEEKDLLQIQDLIEDILWQYIPKIPKIDCQMWSYKEEYLLPPRINLKDFFGNPDICLPLRNLFYLSGIKEIEKIYKQIIDQPKQINSLLAEVSKKATLNFKKNWKVFEEVVFSLYKDGDNLEISIKDKSSSVVEYTMEERSEGFKRFVTILLMLSIGDKKSQKIILLDEPDAFLYPSSAKQLRDVLVEMGKNSIIFYSTHSPYMIDINAVGENSRHLIIEKIDGVTQINSDDSFATDRAKFIEDELIMRAIGSNIFERVKPINILFEGYLDKKLFEKFWDKEWFEKYGKIYIGGITYAIECINNIQLTGQKFLVVADSDSTSSSEKRKFEKLFSHFKKSWLDYAETGKGFQTLEDFFCDEYVKDLLQNKGYSVEKYDIKKPMMDNIKACILANCDKHSKYLEDKEELNKIKQYLDKYEGDQTLIVKVFEKLKGISQSEQQRMKNQELIDRENQIKYELVAKAKKENMRDDFFVFIDKLKERLKNM